MSGKAGARAMQRRMRPTCDHLGALWQTRWTHDGSEDKRLGGCPGCGIKLEQRGPCLAHLRAGPCRDPQGPELPPATRLNQAAPGWPVVSQRPSWARRALAWLLLKLGRVK